MTPTLFDLARYYRNKGLVGEDRAAIASLVALAGGASCIARGYPGTGKTHLADITAALLPDLAQVDMVSKLGIWSKGQVDAIAKARFVYFPEDQNAGDNEEVVKVKKKWGDGKPATRARSEDMGQDTSLTELPCRVFLSTAAITNEAHAKSFDVESARRVVKVSTDPGEAATRRVLESMADAMVRGKKNVKTMTPLEARAIEKHAERALTADAIAGARFFGAGVLVGAIPTCFPETRSAFALFEKVLLGVGRWYGDGEIVVDGEVFLSPQRVAETWAFYGDILEENALKWETSDREILGRFPAPKWNASTIDPACTLDMDQLMAALKPFGLTDKALVKRQVFKLITKGFLETKPGPGGKGERFYRTDLANTANRIDWAAVVAACRKEAPKHLTGDALARYLALCDQAASPRGMQNPLTGKVGPIWGDGSVLYYHPDTGSYAPVGTEAAKQPAAPKGLEAFA